MAIKTSFVAISAALALGITATGVHATEIDISSYVNYSFSPLGLSGSVQGNAGTSVSSQYFNLLSASGGANNLWRGASPGDSVDIKLNIPDATQALTLLNTFYGEAVNTATVTFYGTGKTSISFTLVGNTDIRDYNNAVWTNAINGTTTQEWATNNLSPGPYDQTHRQDAQIYNLGSTFAGQTLTDIEITAGPYTGVNATEPVLFAVDVTSAGAVPEVSTWAMMLLGFAGVGFAGYRKSRMSARLAA